MCSEARGSMLLQFRHPPKQKEKQLNAQIYTMAHLKLINGILGHVFQVHTLDHYPRIDEICSDFANISECVRFAQLC